MEEWNQKMESEWYQKIWAQDLALSLKEPQRKQAVSLLTWLTPQPVKLAEVES